LARILADKSAESIHFALLIFWMLHSIPNDPEEGEELPEDTALYLEELQVMCEAAAIHAAIDSPLASVEEHERKEGLSVEGGATGPGGWVDQARSDRFNLALSFVLTLTTIGKRLIDYPKALRQEVLQRQLEVVNCLNLPGDGVQVPSLTHGAPFIVRVAPGHCALLNSRDKTPYLVHLEVVDAPDLAGAQQIAGGGAGGALPSTPNEASYPSPEASGYTADAEDPATPPRSPRLPVSTSSPVADPFTGLMLPIGRSRRGSRESLRSVSSHRSRESRSPRSRSVSPGESRPTPRANLEEPVWVIRCIDTGEIMKMEETNEHVELCLHRSLSRKVAATGEALPEREPQLFSTDESMSEGEYSSDQKGEYSSDQKGGSASDCEGSVSGEVSGSINEGLGSPSEGVGPVTRPYEGVVAAGAGRGSDGESDGDIREGEMGQGWKWWSFGWGKTKKEASGSIVSSREATEDKAGEETGGTDAVEDESGKPEDTSGMQSEEMMFMDDSELALMTVEIEGTDKDVIESVEEPTVAASAFSTRSTRVENTEADDDCMLGPGIASSLPSSSMLETNMGKRPKPLDIEAKEDAKEEAKEQMPASQGEMMDSPGLASSLEGAPDFPAELVIPPAVCDTREAIKPPETVTVTTPSGDELDLSMGQSPKEWATGGASDPNDDGLHPSMVGVALADLVFGKQLQATEAIVKKESPYASLPSWRLVAAIVKSGDSFLQERLALQLIAEMAAVFKEAGLPIRLCAYKVLIDSSLSGLIQAVPNAISIHTLKSNGSSGSVTLSSLFGRIHKDNPDELDATRRRFANSLAGYSVVCYLMQIKDRHNGNILIDRQGNVVHIDFGFMLSNSPGQNMNFEQAPFKLTSESVDFIGGIDSPQWAYYQRLVVGGFLALRQQWQRVIQLVEMTLESHPDLPCFDSLREGRNVVEELVSRFCLDKSDEECEEHVMGLIEESVDHWTTWQYDSFQYMSNGILYS